MLVSVELDAASRLVVIKRAVHPGGSARLAHEMAVLEAARHPGVVDLLATTDDGGAPAVITRWVGPRTLAAVTGLPLTNAAAVMAAVADVVADLHEIGLVHGRLEAEHVLIAADGRPVLCGLGEASWRSHGTTDGARPAADVGALGRMLRTLTGDVELEPIPDRRSWRRPRWQGYQRRALLTLADQATHDDPSLRPTARSLAASIHHLMPDAHLEPPPNGASTRWPNATAPRMAHAQHAPAGPMESQPAEPTATPEPLSPPAPPGDGEHDADWAESVPAEGPWSPFVVSRPIDGHGRAEQMARVGGTVSVRAERAADVDTTGEFQLAPPEALVAPDPARRPFLDGDRLRRALPVLAGAVGVILVVLGVAQLRDRRAPMAISQRQPLQGPQPSIPASTTTRTRRSTTAPPTTARPAAGNNSNSTSGSGSGGRGSSGPGARSCARVAEPAADLDGDGCPEAVQVDDAGVVAGGVRYAVGRAGDRIAIGDWDCDGRATPAVLRPATGEVFVFPRWAPSRRPLTVGPSATIAGATAITPSALDARGCADLEVRTASGQVTVPVEGEP